MDFSDHKVWRLLLTVGVGEVRALFVNRATGACVPYLARRWECPPQDVLHNIEEALYEEPMLFEEYDATILLRPAATLLVPPELAKDASDQNLSEAISALDPMEEKDVWSEPVGEAIALCSMPGGVRGFLGRSFLTEDVRHALKPGVEHFAPRAAREGGDKMWAHLGERSLDMYAFRDGRLLEASTHTYHAPMDAAYALLFAWRALGLDAVRGELRLSGSAEVRKTIMEPLRAHLSYVGLTVNATQLSASLEAGVDLSEALTALNIKDK